MLNMHPQSSKKANKKTSVKSEVFYFKAYA